jgi:hypothetical protein
LHNVPDAIYNYCRYYPWRIDALQASCIVRKVILVNHFQEPAAAGRDWIAHDR